MEVLGFATISGICLFGLRKSKQQLNENVKTIKTMELYNNVERIFNQLNSLGIKNDEPIDINVLQNYDQYHYLGTDACDKAIEEFNLNDKSIGETAKILDVGSGIGGPARYIASKTKAKIVALELQADLNETATILTKRCGLSQYVQHVNGDILQDETINKLGEKYSHLMSWLVFLHIKDRKKLFQKCFKSLQPGGKVYIEDFMYSGFPLSARDQEYLKTDVFCDYLPSKEQYKTQLGRAGFVDIEFEDVTDSWRTFVRERTETFVSNYHKHVLVQGNETADALRHFYIIIERLFSGGSVSGVIVRCRKPNENEPLPKLSEVYSQRTFTKDGYRKRAGCVCVKDNKVLLVGSSKYANKWSIPAGGVDPGETFEIAAVRECEEEAGVTGRRGEFIGEFKADDKMLVTQGWILHVDTVLEDYEELGQRAREWFPLDGNFENLLFKVTDKAMLQKAKMLLKRQ